MKKLSFLNVWLFFAVVYLSSFLLYLPVLLSGSGRSALLNSILMALVAFVPSVTGIIFIYLTKGPEERRDFWKRSLHWPSSRTKMAILGLLLLPLLTITSFLVSSFINGMQLSLEYADEVLTNWKVLLTFLFVEITLGPISEELGWRGYVLDELQSRWNALTSSLVLGLVWGLWHSPAFLIPGMPQHEMGGIFSWTYVCFLISVAFGSILHTWVYNNTGRSILLAGILMHFAQNAAMTFLGGIFERFIMPPAYWVVTLVVTGITAALILLLYGPKTLTHQAGIKEPLVPRFPTTV